MSNTLKNILTFFAILIASFLILLGAIYVQNLPPSVVTPPPTATSTPLVWNPADINSKDVSILLLERTGNNPNTYVVEQVLASSTPNTGNAGMITLASNEVVQVGCLPSANECHAVIINP